jgi:CheY-like chemotaxis protein
MCNTHLKVLIVENTPERQTTLKHLFKDHAWVLVNTAKRAKMLLGAFDFDLILLDFDLDGPDTGEEIARHIPASRNAHAKVWIHSMNAQGAAKILHFLPDALALPYSKIIRDNLTFKALQAELENGLYIVWAKVFRRKH